MSSLVLPFLFTVGWDSRIPRLYDIFGATVSIILLLGGTHVSPDSMTSLVLPFLFTVGWDSRIPRLYDIFGATVSIYCWVGLTYPQIL